MNNDDLLYLKSEIIHRIQNITNDCRTFLWVRSVYRDDLDNESIKIGGGNLTIALALFNAIGYLSNTFYCLTKKDISKLEYNSAGIYDPNTYDSFKYFIKNQKSGVALGIEGLSFPELHKIWDDWRNKLSHFCVQRYGNTSLSFVENKSRKNRDKYLKFISTNNYKSQSFGKIGGGWNIHIDFLNLQMDILANYIAEKILTSANQDNVLVFKKWLEFNLH